MTTQEYYRKSKHDFNLSVTEEQSKLLNHQTKLEEKFGRVGKLIRIDDIYLKHFVMSSNGGSVIPNFIAD